MLSGKSTRASSTGQIARAATLVMALFLASKVTGLAREMIISARFGTSPDYDAYVAAFRVPDLLFQLIAGGALSSAFIPVFAGYLARRDRSGAWQLFSAVTNLVLIVLVAAAALAAILAPLLVRDVLAPGFTPEQQALTASLVRWMLISTVMFGVSGLMMSALNSHGHFLMPALGPVLYNLSIIGGAWFLAPSMGVQGMVVGVIIGAGLHLDAQLIGLWWYGARYQRTLGLSDPRVREVGRLMAPRLLGLAAVQINFWINTILASGLGAGSVSALNYAWMIVLLPEGIVAQAVATAAFPTFAALGAQRRFGELRRVLCNTLRAVLFITIPATVGLFVWRTPLVRMLLERGQFTAHSTELTAYALAFYSLGLIGLSVTEIVARGFYALHDTRTPVIIALVSLVLNTAISLWARGPLGFGGLALGDTTANTFEMVALLVLLTWRIGGMDLKPLVNTALRSGVATIAMAVPLLWAASHLGTGHALLVGAGGLVVGALIYLAGAALLGMPELPAVWSMVLHRQPGKRAQQGGQLVRH